MHLGDLSHAVLGVTVRSQLCVGGFRGNHLFLLAFRLSSRCFPPGEKFVFWCLILAIGPPYNAAVTRT